MRRFLLLLAAAAFVLPIGILASVVVWLNLVAGWKRQVMDFGMKLPQHDQIMLDVADFADAYLPLLGVLLVVPFWGAAVGLFALMMLAVDVRVVQAIRERPWRAGVWRRRPPALPWSTAPALLPIR